MPRGCEDLLAQWPLRLSTPFWPAWTSWTAWAWVDREPLQIGQQMATAGNETDQAIMCEFRRWDGYRGATPEREEALAQNPLARGSWTQEVAKVMPPVTDWAQERWDIQIATEFLTPEEEEERRKMELEEKEYERLLIEFRKQESLSR
ncbi:hypothetical protein GGR54DRAFT_438095 [Hypoxylon sp. NC1633]|nr:hypothetical protein GGR54DRAFT_438095 [Hypoxylon sp. NC1633]